MAELTRREFVKGSIVSGLVGAGSVAFAAAGAGGKPGDKELEKRESGKGRKVSARKAGKDFNGGKRPNILLIHSDQHRYDCLGFSKHPLVKTPNMDRLAREGMWFDNAFTPIPTCCPARQCLLSGKWPEHHGGLWNYEAFLPVRLFDEPTWSEAIQDSGYQTGYVGKWHVHPEKTPLDFGFDDYVSDEEYHKWRAAQKLPPVKQLSPDFWFGGMDPAPLEKTHTHWLAEQAIQLIRRYQKRGEPWHIRLDHAEPHLPCYPTQAFLDLYKQEDIQPWGNFPDSFQNKPYLQKQQLVNWGLENYTWRDWAPYVHRYLAMISQIDDAIGLVLNALKELGLEKDTVVVYTADHGDACGGHGMIDKHYVMYEDVVHVPLIVRWPGVVKPGSRSESFVINELDLASTMPEVAGVEFAGEGRSLLPLLRGTTPGDWRKYAFSTYNGQQFGLVTQRMIRDERWKYVWNLTDVDELYDLREDPWELENRVGKSKYGAELARLRQDLAKELKRRGDPAFSVWVEKQLLEGRKIAP